MSANHQRTDGGEHEGISRVRGIRGGAIPPMKREDGRRRSPDPLFCGMKLDPNTHGFVLATALFTSLFFAIGAWIPVLLLLRWVIPG